MNEMNVVLALLASVVLIVAASKLAQRWLRSRPAPVWYTCAKCRSKSNFLVTDLCQECQFAEYAANLAKKNSAHN